MMEFIHTLHPDVKACLITTLIMVTWVEGMKFLAHQNLLQSWQRRKLVHIFTGPIFILTWPMFSYSHFGRQLAAFVPFIVTLKFLLVGLGIISDPDTVQSMSRSGRRQELLYGPLLYGIIFVVTTYLYWKSVKAIICLLILCFGDGFAEILGKRYGQKHKLPWSPRKSYAGWMGFTLCSTLSICLILVIFQNHLFAYNNSDGHFLKDGSKDGLTDQYLRDVESFHTSSFVAAYLPRILIDCLVAGLIETLPFEDIDNVTVFIAALLTDSFFQ
jgi:dolichol kinase